MNDVLACFRNHFLPHVIAMGGGGKIATFRCIPLEIENPPLRKMVETTPLLIEWLYHCVPREVNSFRFGVGCDPYPISELSKIYEADSAILDLASQRIFLFANDGSGYPYGLAVDSGTIFRAWSAWGDSTHRLLEEVIDQEWDSLADFTVWLHQGGTNSRQLKKGSGG